MSRLHSFSVSGVGDNCTVDTALLPCSLSERVVYVERLSFFDKFLSTLTRDILPNIIWLSETRARNPQLFFFSFLKFKIIQSAYCICRVDYDAAAVFPVLLSVYLYPLLSLFLFHTISFKLCWSACVVYFYCTEGRRKHPKGES